MQVNLRREPRRAEKGFYSLVWKDRLGRSLSAQVEAMDLSSSGIGLRCASELETGAVVYVEHKQGRLAGYCSVRSCVRRGGAYRLGLEFHDETKRSLAPPSDAEIDYYEYLQISPKAEQATIHRVYKIMAARLHPDNPETGDTERFLLLNRAYTVLSDPERRAQYDAAYHNHDFEQNPIFEMSEFVNGIEGETNRRLGVLSLLYHRRRTNSEHPGVSMFEIEKRMGFPREYLDFTTWYLKGKQYITMGDNAELTLTTSGVDYVESNAEQIPILQKLLTSGPKTTTGPDPQPSRARGFAREPLALGTSEPAPDPATTKVGS